MTTSREELPEVKKPRAPGAAPGSRSWVRIDENTAQCLQVVRTVLLKVSKRIGTAPKVIPGPRTQHFVAWVPLEINRPPEDEIKEHIYEQGTRNWQMNLCPNLLTDILEG